MITVAPEPIKRVGDGGMVGEDVMSILWSRRHDCIGEKVKEAKVQ